jgi:hypothetical protein
MASTYFIGQIARLEATFTTTDGSFVDPTLVTFTVLPPGSTSIEVTSASTSVVHPSTGVYYYDQEVTLPGTWNYRSHSTGVGQSAGESWFVARHTQVDT